MNLPICGRSDKSLENMSGLQVQDDDHMSHKFCIARIMILFEQFEVNYLLIFCLVRTHSMQNHYRLLLCCNEELHALPLSISMHCTSSQDCIFRLC